MCVPLCNIRIVRLWYRKALEPDACACNSCRANTWWLLQSALYWEIFFVRSCINKLKRNEINKIHHIQQSKLQIRTIEIVAINWSVVLCKI
jgi:hypothetical protein